MLLVVLTLGVIVPLGSRKMPEEVGLDVSILFVFAEILLFEFPDFLGAVKLVFFLCFISFVFADVATIDGFPSCFHMRTDYIFTSLKVYTIAGCQ